MAVVEQLTLLLHLLLEMRQELEAELRDRMVVRVVAVELKEEVLVLRIASLEDIQVDWGDLLAKVVAVEVVLINLDTVHLMNQIFGDMVVTVLIEVLGVLRDLHSVLVEEVAQ